MRTKREIIELELLWMLSAVLENGRVLFSLCLLVDLTAHLSFNLASPRQNEKTKIPWT
jgi:hypothetical protein